MKNFNYSIGNRILDLPACSAVPQPSVPPRASKHKVITPLLLCFAISFISIFAYVLIFIFCFLSASVHLSHASIIVPFFPLNPFQ
jgi:uncharacterized membrane protein YbhN (UPF0104 family)